MDSQQPSHVRFRNEQGSSHVVDLPYDILVINFTLCWKEKGGKKVADEDEEEGGGSHFPTIASHVCGAWRQHALPTPAFWAILEFRQRKPPREKYETWLKRSGDCPLDIIIGPQPFKASSINHA